MKMTETLTRPSHQEYRAAIGTLATYLAAGASEYLTDRGVTAPDEYDIDAALSALIEDDTFEICGLAKDILNPYEESSQSS